MTVQYRVKAGHTGFYGGVYRTEFLHSIIEVDAPLKPVPQWLEKVPGESVEAAKARLEAERKVSEEAAKKVESDQKDLANVTGEIKLMDGDATPPAAADQSAPPAVSPASRPGRPAAAKAVSVPPPSNVETLG